MEKSTVDYSFLILDFLESFRMYHTYDETIQLMEDMILQKHIPILTKDLKNISKEVISLELSKAVLNQIKNDNKKVDLTPLLPAIIGKSIIVNKEENKFKLVKWAIAGTVAALAVVGATYYLKSDSTSTNTKSKIIIDKDNIVNMFEPLYFDNMNVKEKVINNFLTKPKIKVIKKKKVVDQKKKVLNSFKKCRSLEDILKREKELKKLGLTEKDKIYKNCSLSAPLQRFMYEQSVVNKVPVDFIFSIIYTESRGDFNTNKEKSYNAKGNYDLGLTQQNTISSVRMFSDVYKVDYQKACDLVLNDPYVNVASFFLEMSEIRNHLKDKYRFDTVDGIHEISGHYNGWCNWENKSISRQYIRINDKAYNKKFTKHHDIKSKK